MRFWVSELQIVMHYQGKVGTWSLEPNTAADKAATFEMLNLRARQMSDLGLAGSDFTSKRSGTQSFGDWTPTRKSSSTISKTVRKTAKSLMVERTCAQRKLRHNTKQV